MKRLFLAFVFVLSGCASTAPAPERWFKYIDYDKGRVTTRLGFHRVIETDYQGYPISSDTLWIYAEHFGPGEPITGKMLVADLLLMCYPNELPVFLRERHVFPDKTGLIYAVDIMDTPLFVVITEDVPEWIQQLIDRGDMELPEIPE